MTLGFNRSLVDLSTTQVLRLRPNRNKILKLATGVTNLTHEVFDLKDIVRVASVCVKVVSSVTSMLASD